MTELLLPPYPALRFRRLRQADWVLTTYETLRDYDRDFGQVRFSALLFDEAQKIKTPGVRVTDAAKAMNAEFGTTHAPSTVDEWLKHAKPFDSNKGE